MTKRRGIHRFTSIGLLLGAAALAPPTSAAEIYRVDNPDGTVTYTDRPKPGTKRTRVAVDTTANNFPAERQRYDGPAAAADPAAVNPYTGITISSPAMEANFHSAEGLVPLTFVVQPALRVGDTARVRVDGQLVSIGIGADGLGQLRGIERGSHTLTIEVVGSNGRVLHTSSPVTFFMHKPSVLLGPNARPNGPARRPAGAALTPPPKPKPTTPP